MGLRELVEMSNRYGSSAEYVLAGGGNTSFKEGNKLYVKSSGTSLATIKAEEFVIMDREKLTSMMNNNYPENEKEREAEALKDMMAARLPGEENKRPSVEALLHNLFSQKYVLHVHPALVNGLTCGNDGERMTEELFGKTALWLPLCRPGYILARESEKAIKYFENKNQVKLQVLLLQNHGIFFAADSVEEIDRLVNDVFGKLNDYVKTEIDFSECKYDFNIVDKTGNKLQKLSSDNGLECTEFFINNEIKGYIQNDETLKPIIDPFTPDHIVYCKAKYLILDKNDDIELKYKEFISDNEYSPKIAIIKGIGVFAIGKNEKDADTVKALFSDAVKIASYSKYFGGYKQLPQDFIDFITNWEAESYRQKALK